MFLTGVLTAQVQKDPAYSLTPQKARELRDLNRSIVEIVSRRRVLDETVWNLEVLAQEYEGSIIDLWDRLRHASNKLSLLAQHPFDTIAIPERSHRREWKWNISEIVFASPNRILTNREWSEAVHRFEQNGYRLEKTEWHHSAFEKISDGGASSIFNVTLYLNRQPDGSRLTVRGRLFIEWSAERSEQGHFLAKEVSVQDLTVLEWREPPAFTEWAEFESVNRSGSVLLVGAYDLNEDGYAELILPADNSVYWNRAGVFERAELCRYPIDSISAFCLADFNLDGFVDLFAAGQNDFPALFMGSEGGRFVDRSIPVPAPGLPLIEPQSISVGDVNGDGLPDVWIAQYKRPYVRGQLPTPFYDAMDGYPAYLLINMGEGNFRDATKASGLGSKRNRRTYSSSLVDLDNDDDLDLVVVSDFAGVDVYLNDGSGVFRDVSESFLDVRHTFGMSHTFGDYNGDGQLDLFVAGMSSTTVKRLERMGLGRERYGELESMRGPMTYGNYLFLSRPDGSGLRRAPFNDDVARLEWAWGSTTFDFENDGFVDIYVANGHISKESARDYCTIYWRHDIYEGTSDPNMQLMSYFNSPLISGDMSWNPFESNALLMNVDGNRFLNVGHLMGVAFQYDSRGVLSEDFDGDGRTDLVVVEMSLPKAKVHLYRNRWPRENHWIGVRVFDEPDVSPIGAKIRVIINNKSMAIAQIVNGDSVYSQHSLSRVFGLGANPELDAIEVEWLNGVTTRIESPEANRYYTLRPVLPSETIAHERTTRN